MSDFDGGDPRVPHHLPLGSGGAGDRDQDRTSLIGRAVAAIAAGSTSASDKVIVEAAITTMHDLILAIEEGASRQPGYINPSNAINAVITREMPLSSVFAAFASVFAQITNAMAEREAHTLGVQSDPLRILMVGTASHMLASMSEAWIKRQNAKGATE